MKKLVALSLFLTPFAGMVAQPDSTNLDVEEEVEIEVKGSRVTIDARDLSRLSQLDLNAIIREVTAHSRKIQAQHRQMMAQVNEQLAKGEITEEEAEEMREMIDERTEESMEVIGEMMEAWGEQYEAKMEVWEQEYEARMEAWENDVERRSESGAWVMPPLPPMPPVPVPAPPEGAVKDNDSRTVIIDENGITLKRNANGEEPFALKFNKEKDSVDPEVDPEEINRTEGYLDFNLGFNQQLREGREFIYNSPDELKFFRSNEVNIGAGWKTRIGSPFSKFYIRYGGEFSFHDFKLQENNYLNKTAEKVEIIEDTTRNVSYSKYKIAYFNIPVMLQFDFSEMGETDESFSIGVGGYAGIRMGAKRKLEYTNELYKNGEETLKDDFYTNQFRYGLMAQVGFGSFKITGKYDLNTFFRTNRGPDYQLASITFGWVL